MDERSAAKIREALESLSASRFPETRVLIEQGPVYLQFVREHGGKTTLEAASSAELPPEFKLSTARANEMRKLGFLKNGGRNWLRDLREDEHDGLARCINVDPLVEHCADVLQRIYGADGEIHVELIHARDEHPENEDLVSSMRQLARTRSGDARRRMYTELVNATLLIPVNPEAPDELEGGDEFLVTDTLDGHPVFLAFSDWDSLRRWNPRGWCYVPVHGSEFFELTLERDLGSVQINPNGEVGGELYRHEIEMLVEGVRNYRKMMMN